jgi:hypothetical protein
MDLARLIGDHCFFFRQPSPPMRLPLLISTLLLVLPFVATAQPTPDRSVQRILDGAKIRYQVDQAGDFRATFDLGEGRTQLVIIRSGVDRVAGIDTREIRAIGYRAPSDPFPTEAASRLLDENNHRVLGKWGKQGTLGVLTVRVPADAKASTLIDAIEMAARDADAMERSLIEDRDEF